MNTFIENKQGGQHDYLLAIKAFLSLLGNSNDNISLSEACKIAELTEMQIDSEIDSIRNLSPEKLSELTQKPTVSPAQCADELRKFWAQCRIFAYLVSDKVLYQDKLRLLEEFSRNELIISDLLPEDYMTDIENAIKDRQPVHDDVKALFPDLSIDFEKIKSLCLDYVLPGYPPSVFLQRCNTVTEYLVEGFLPRGSFVVAYGEPKIGKTHFAIDLALSLATEKPFLGRRTQRCRVAYIQKEESDELFGQKLTKWCEANSISPRELDKNLRIIGLSAHFPQLFTSSTSKTVNQHSVKEWERISEHYDVVILDTLLSTTGANENDTNIMEKIGETLNTLKANGCTIIALFHSKKNNPKEYRGVANTKQLADIMYCISRDNEEGYNSSKLLLQTNGTRYGEPISQWFSIDYDSCRVKPENSPEEEEIEKQLTQIAELIATEEFGSEKELMNAITKSLGIGRKKAKKLLERGMGTRWKVKEIPGRGNPRRVYNLIANAHPGSSDNLPDNANIANEPPLYIRCDEKGERYELSIERQSVKRTPYKVNVGNRYAGCSLNSSEQQLIKRTPSTNGHLKQQTNTYQGERLIAHSSGDTANVHLNITDPPLCDGTFNPEYSVPSSTLIVNNNFGLPNIEQDRPAEVLHPSSSTGMLADSMEDKPIQVQTYTQATSLTNQNSETVAENTQQEPPLRDLAEVKANIIISDQRPDTSHYDPVKSNGAEGQLWLVRHNGEEKVFKIEKLYYVPDDIKRDLGIYWLGKRIDKHVEEYLWGRGGDIQKYGRENITKRGDNIGKT